MTYQLIQEWIVNHTNNRDTFYSKSDRSADHGISMDLSSAPPLCYSKSQTSSRREEGGRKDVEEGGGHTKLVVPSIGLISA